jgi:hypothetical protein
VTFRVAVYHNPTGLSPYPEIFLVPDHDGEVGIGDAIEMALAAVNDGDETEVVSVTARVERSRVLLVAEEEAFNGQG